MASGSTITATGMQTMTQVVAGTDLIEDQDFNNMLINVERLLGTSQDVTLGTYNAAATYGYNQGGTGLSAVSTGDVVRANNSTYGFKQLQDDVQLICVFLGISNTIFDATSSTVITAADWNQMMIKIRDCWNARFNPAGRTPSTDGSKTYTSEWGGLVNEEIHGDNSMHPQTLTQTTTWTFANEASCRAYFNMGGQLGVSGSRSGGSSSAQNTQWTNKLSALGTCWLTHNSCTAGAGTLSGKGFYELTTSDQRLVIYYGGAAPYSNDYVEVKARVNSTTNPTQVIITTVMHDSGDNVKDASVDGTMTINARRNAPNTSGSGVVIPVPTDGMGNITAS